MTWEDELYQEIYEILDSVINEYYNSPNRNFNKKNLYLYDNWKDMVVDKIIDMLNAKGMIPAEDNDAI